MAQYPRYSIYYAATPGSDLDRFGAHLLGYDAYSGELLGFPEDLSQAVPDWFDLTFDPRKYGFHATLKAPFALADGKTVDGLLAACEAFAGTARIIPRIRPVVDSISGFIAVVPAEPAADLNRLAADCTSEFDSFRPPLTSEDRARRNPSKLTARQLKYLDRWGYPYVMEEFRFHMTLTGRLDRERREPMLAMLRDRFAKIDSGMLAIDAIALCVQESPASAFRIINRWKLHENDADRPA
jgi:putative phosphonate metabolism protein